MARTGGASAQGRLRVDSVGFEGVAVFAHDHSYATAVILGHQSCFTIERTALRDSPWRLKQISLPHIFVRADPVYPYLSRFAFRVFTNDDVHDAIASGDGDLAWIGGAW